MLYYIFCFILCTSSTLQAWAQLQLPKPGSQSFGWKLSGFSENLEACKDYSIELIANPNNPVNATNKNYFGVPPYYMFAVPEGGQPTNTTLGKNLSWAPTHPPGTKLILQMTDSLGNTGGTANTIFTVVTGSETGCIQAPRPPFDFTISSTKPQNAALDTCEFWRLNVNGGTPPYTVVLDAVNSPVLTFIPLERGEDALRWPNRADPGFELFATVQDSTGRWATGTPFVQPSGSTDTICGKRMPRTGLRSELDSIEQAELDAQATKRQKGVVVGVVVTLLLLLVLGGIGGWLYLRRRKASKNPNDTLPRQFSETNISTSRPTSSVDPFVTLTSPTFTTNIQATSLTTLKDPFSDPEVPQVSQEQWSPSTTISLGSNLRPRPSFAQFPKSSVRRSAKALEAAQEGVLTRNPSTIPSRLSSTHPPWPERSGSLQASSIPEEVIIQHEDAGPGPMNAGPVVHELPPPYKPTSSVAGDTT